jgi:hypothetical protein
MAGDRIIANIGPPRSDALGVAWVGRVVVGGDTHDDLVLSGSAAPPSVGEQQHPAAHSSVGW